jgi:hypothetical protein
LITFSRALHKQREEEYSRAARTRVTAAAAAPPAVVDTGDAKEKDPKPKSSKPDVVV